MADEEATESVEVPEVSEEQVTEREVAVPRDRKVSATAQRNEAKRNKKALNEWLDTSLDLAPFTVQVDANDPYVWEFVSDPMPTDVAYLQEVGMSFQEAAQASGDDPSPESITALGEAMETLIEALSNLLYDEEQTEAFKSRFRRPGERPSRQKPYGQTALLWVYYKVLRGKTGFPTSQD